MNRRPILLLVLIGCLLMAVPAMAATVGAQTADDGTTNETDTTTNETDTATNDTDTTTNETDTTTNETDTTNETETTSDTSFAFDATLDSETVTVSVTSNDTAVANASVAVDGTAAGTTDTNGTLQFGLDNRSAVAIGVTVDNSTRSTTYDVVEGSLVERPEPTAEPVDFTFDADLDSGTVTVTVASNGTAVDNASVAVNGTTQGPTDANGTLQFGLDDRPAVELAVTVDATTQTTTYVVVGGQLVTQESVADAQEVPEAAADQVSTIQRLISAFRNGEFEKLGPIISEAAGRGPPVDIGNGQGNAPANAGNGQGNAPDGAGPPANAGNGQ